MRRGILLTGSAADVLQPPGADNGARACAIKLTRRDLLTKGSALAGTAVLTALSACGGGGGNAPAAATGGPLPVPAQPPVAADVRADVSLLRVETAARVDSRYAGLSFEKSKLAVPMFTPGNAALTQLFHLLGPSVLRVGANGVDSSSWNGAVGGLTPILPAQIDALAAFAQATQWQVIYGVNLARNSPADAASEAAYVAARMGPALLAWEIGNEPDLYRRLGYRPQSWRYEDYLAEWRALHDAMSQASPGVAFSGPATAFDVTGFTLPFARDEGPRLTLLTHHHYRADRNDPHASMALLLQPDQGLLQELSSLVPAAAAAGVPQGLRLAEANSFFNGGLPNVSNAYGSALWLLDFGLTCAVAGCTGMNLHSTGRGDEPGYMPIADRDGVVVEARPEFYGMLMLARAGPGVSLRGVVVASAAIDVTAWGVGRDDGGLGAILINKDDQRSVGVDLATGVAATRFDPLWLRGTGLGALTGQTLGGASIGSDGSWTPKAQEPMVATDGRLAVVLPPASAVLVRSAS